MRYLSSSHVRCGKLIVHGWWFWFQVGRRQQAITNHMFINRNFLQNERQLSRMCAKRTIFMAGLHVYRRRKTRARNPRSDMTNRQCIGNWSSYQCFIKSALSLFMQSSYKKDALLRVLLEKRCKSIGTVRCVVVEAWQALKSCQFSIRSSCLYQRISFQVRKTEPLCPFTMTCNTVDSGWNRRTTLLGDMAAAGFYAALHRR